MPDPNAIQPDATASVPPNQPTSAPINGQLQPPAAAPAPPTPIAAPAQTTPPPITATSPNPHMHSFISRILGAFAGPPPTTYATTPEGKVIPDPNQRPDRNVDKVGRIVGHALVGLSAPSPQEKSGLATGLAGIGAGFNAVSGKLSAEDQAAKEDARKNFEQEQQATLRKYDIANANARNFQLHYQNLKAQNDLDPARAQNKEIADAFRTMPDHGVKEMAASAAEAAIKDPNNPTWVHTHLVLPAGFQDVTDANMNPLKDAQGNFRQEGRVFVIDGMKDGKVPLPSSIESDIKKYKDYGELAKIPGLDALHAVDEYDADKFIRLYGALQSSKVSVEKGWTEAEISEDKDGNVIQRNPVNNESKAATPAQTQKFQMDKANLEKAQKFGEVTPADRYKEEQANYRAKLKEKQDAAVNTDAFGNTSHLPSKEFDKRYDAFNKSKQYQNLQVLQGSYQQFQQAVNDINAGKDLTGAASVVGLFNAIGISATPLQGKGFRINENTIKEHVDARGLDQAAYQKLLALKSGAVITPKQLKDYANIAAGVYRDSYINAANEEKRQLGYVDVLPLGNNEPIDPMTAHLYLKIAGGDPAKARAAAQKSGWIVPQSQ